MGVRRRKNSSKIKIVHLITSLDIGGAQIMLLNLLSKLDYSRYSADVITLKADTALVTQFRKAGVNVVELDFANKRFWSIQRLIEFIRAASPDVVQTWMYHADFLGGLIGMTFPNRWSDTRKLVSTGIIRTI